jgi:hypothetical protein
MHSPKRKLDTQKIRPVGLSDLKLIQHAKQVGFSGSVKSIAFFSEYVWWWRSLERIIGKKRTGISIPKKKDRAYFPKRIFEILMFAENSADLGDTIKTLVTFELEARIGITLPFPAEWPAYRINVDHDRLDQSERGWRKWSLAKLDTRIVDLRKPDDELIHEFKIQLVKLRAEWTENLPFPVNPRKRRDSYFNSSSFRVLELIDRKCTFNEDIDNDAFANVRKAIRERFGTEAKER